jgi:hypothetical protein
MVDLMLCVAYLHSQVDGYMQKWQASAAAVLLVGLLWRFSVANRVLFWTANLIGLFE